MRFLCALLVFVGVVGLDACAKPFGFDVRIGAAPRFWSDGGTNGPGRIKTEPLVIRR